MSRTLDRSQGKFEAMPVSDGAPIVESGSNADGEWTRWADGTQQCTNNALRLFATSQLATIAFSSKSLPRDFVSLTTYSSWSINQANIGNGSLRALGQIYRNGLRMEPSEVSFGLSGYTYTEAIGGDCFISVIAIGRWK